MAQGRMTLNYFLYNLLLLLITLTVLPFFLLYRLMIGRPALAHFRRLTVTQLQRLAGKPVIWLQAVSVGEVVVAAIILKELRRLLPDHAVVLTTTTPTGQAMAEKLLGKTVILAYFPYDLPWVVKRFISQIKPELFLMLEAEIWPNVIRYCRLAGVKMAIVNGLVSDRSFRRYQRFTGFIREVLEQVDLLAMQSVEDANRIGKLGAVLERIRVTGNAKFDQNYPEFSQEEKQTFLRQYGWDAKDRIFVAASTHKGEEEIVINAFCELAADGQYKMILAPRHPERASEVAALLQEAGLSFVRRSAGEAELASQVPQVLLLDTFGELGLAYAVAEVIFVGGSLVPIGGHNVLEAAVQAKPVLYGPYMHKTRESQRLLEEAEAGFTVKDQTDLVTAIRELVADVPTYQKRAAAARKAVLANQGAAGKTAQAVAALLEAAAG